MTRLNDLPFDYLLCHDTLEASCCLFLYKFAKDFQNLQSKQNSKYFPANLGDFEKRIDSRLCKDFLLISVDWNLVDSKIISTQMYFVKEHNI